MSDPQQFPPAPGAPHVPEAMPPYADHGQSAYAAPGYPAQGTHDNHPGAGPAPSGPGLARTALTVAIVGVVLSVVNSLVLQFVIYRLIGPLHLSARTITDYSLVSSIVLLLVYGAALVLGVIAARGPHRLQAGIAIGVGGSGALALLVGLATTLVRTVI